MASEVTKAYTRLQDAVDDAIYDALRDEPGNPFNGDYASLIMKAVDEYAKAIRDEESGS
jgi:hypothetical protein